MSKSLRQQLTEARESCRREIERLTQLHGQKTGGLDGPGGPVWDNRNQIALFEEEYRRLTEALGGLGSDNA
jgi:hypothetical protein